MTLKDYERMKRDLWQDYQQKSNALDIVWEMFRKNDVSEVLPVVVRQTTRLMAPSVFEVTDQVLGAGSVDPPSSGPTSARWGDFRNAIRVAIRKLPHRFTLRDVRRQLEHDDPVMSRQIKGTTLSSALLRMEKLGEIDVVTRGRGRAATIYLRKDTLLAAVARA